MYHQMKIYLFYNFFTKHYFQLNKKYFLLIYILRFAFVQITQACSKNLMDMH